MNKRIYFLSLTLILVLASCGVGGNRFRLKGRLLNMNQGEFYVYSPDDGIDGFDTIKVENGKFAYDGVCRNPYTLVIIFPNFSQQPVFAEPGKSVEIKGDASHLKELEVKGTKDNELMNMFRTQIANASPPEVLKYAKQFIEDHLNSRVSIYILQKYLLQSSRPDYKNAVRYLEAMKKTQNDNPWVTKLYEKVLPMAKACIGDPLPNFATFDTKGKPVTSGELKKAEYAIIGVWASWSYDSQDMISVFHNLKNQWKERLKIVTISVDPTMEDEYVLTRSGSDLWQNICDGEMMQSKTLRVLGLSMVPDNIIVHKGRIVARGVPPQDLGAKLEELSK